MRFAIALGLAALAAGSLTSCDDSSGSSVSTSSVPGTLVQNPPFRIASLTAAALTAQLNATPSGQQLLALAGAPKCGVDFHLIMYSTVGGANESTHASGALMAPTGPGCTGARPIVEYAHGTGFQTNYNIADPTSPATNPAYQQSTGAEGFLIVAFFAAQGYIVVAPNYVGYDTQDVATLPYNPWLNNAQQSHEMMDALAAARAALQSGLPSGVTDNGKLFLTGYSIGGNGVMATQQAMEAAGMTVTATAPMEGLYAAEAQFDANIYGNVSLAATTFLPLLTTSYQKAYGNLYNATTDIYETAYATGIDTLLPNALPLNTLIAQGALPEFAVFNSTPPTGNGAAVDAALAVPTAIPLFALGFGPSNLLNNATRAAYAIDAYTNPDGVVPVPVPANTFLAGFNPPPAAGVPMAATPQYSLRIDLKKNDMRNWTNPMHPMLLCAGHSDADAYYQVNTVTMATLWSAQVSAGLVNVFDVDPGPSFATGGIAAQVAGIAATVYGTVLAGPSPSADAIASGVTAAVIGAYPAYFTFTAQGAIPNSPQGVLVAGVAQVAAQAAASQFPAVTDPVAVGNYVGVAISAYYHGTLAEPACLLAVAGQGGVGGFFQNFHPFN